MRWADVKVGDVLHYNTDNESAHSYLILGTRPLNEDLVTLDLYGLDEGKRYTSFVQESLKVIHHSIKVVRGSKRKKAGE